ncbi:hypothetical protein BSBH6_04308 [Bacillus subtilis]|nr:hypothetical protein BSBH6_04308 [Bacillus subtilis]RPK19957.1 hypothetical protein BH5_04310 [Bacillus subtilis]
MENSIRPSIHISTALCKCLGIFPNEFYPLNNQTNIICHKEKLAC